MKITYISAKQNNNRKTKRYYKTSINVVISGHTSALIMKLSYLTPWSESTFCAQGTFNVNNIQAQGGGSYNTLRMYGNSKLFQVIDKIK